MSVGRFALRHGRAFVFFAVLAAVAGGFEAGNLPKGIYPEVSFPREQVVATLAGAPAETVLVGVTRRLEEVLTGIPGIVRVRSRTVRGASELSLYFAPDADMTALHPQVLARTAELRSALPPGTEVTTTRVLQSGFPILSLNVEGPYPPSELYLLAQYTLRPALSGLPSAGLVSVQSSDVPELHVLLAPNRLAAAHLTVSQVADRLKQHNRVQSVARLTDLHELSLGVVTGSFQTADEVARTVVGGTDVDPVRVADLGTVTEGLAPQTTVIRTDGRAGVILNVARRPGGDALELDGAVRARLDQLRPALPPGVTITPVYVQAEFISDGVRGVRDAVMFGALFSIIVLAAFLRDFRATLVVASSLPLTLGATLLVLAALGQTLNLMSLGGLAIAVGLVIDDAVVVVEAIHRHLEAGASPAEAAQRGTDELFWPVVGTTLTTVVVFLPLGFLSGVAGQFFLSLSLALASAVLISLPVALLVLPALAARWLSRVPVPAKSRESTRIFNRLQMAVFRRPVRALGGAVIFLLIAGALSTRLPTDFLPEADEGSYVIDYYAPVASSLAETDRLAQLLEEVLRKTPEVTAFNRRLGTELGPPVATLPSRGDVAVRLSSKRTRGVDAIMDAQREAISQVAPGLRVEFVQVLSDMLGDLQGSPEPIEVKLFGPDPAVISQLAADASKRIRDVPGLVDFFDGDEGCAPETDLRIDSFEASRVGLSTSTISDQLAAAFTGEVATQVRRSDRLEDVRVKVAGIDPMAPPPSAMLEEARVTAPNGATVPILALARSTRTCPAAVLLRENQRNMGHLTARLSGVSLGTAAGEIRQRLKAWQLPVGYTWELGGLLEQQRSSFRSLLTVFFGALAGVLGILLFQLRSFRYAGAVLAATPVAVAGAVITLWLAGVSLNVSSLMGVILLVGLVVKNGILLVDQAIASESAGMTRREAFEFAQRIRLRPILMTTLATLVALTPLVVGIGSGGALLRPLAIAVVGGLAFSTLATLLLVPLLAGGARTGRPGTPG
jgi:multidrug efflux pump subunit AcrB